MKRRLVLLLLLALGGAASAQQRIEVDSLDALQGNVVRLPGYWFAAAGAARAPAWVLLHSCAGAYDGEGRLSRRMREYARLINEHGQHALVLDSFTPRGEKELCTQRNAQRSVTQIQRRRDALGALRWLAARADVDAERLGLLGWSNGASTVLAATNAAHPEVAAAPARASRAVAFYPGCVEEQRRGYRAVAPLLLLLGQADDWTPIGPCEALASAHAPAPPIEVQVYAGAYHGFDAAAPVRVRRDVPGGARPGAGVHVGGDSAAREASRAALRRWLEAMQQRAQ